MFPPPIPPNFSSFLRNSKISTKIAFPWIRADLSICCVFGSFGPRIFCFRTPSTFVCVPKPQFCQFPTKSRNFEPNFRPNREQEHQKTGPAVLPPGQRYYRHNWNSGTTGLEAVLPPGLIFAEIFLFLVRFGISSLLFESFCGVINVYNIDKLPQQRFINAKRRRHQGLDISPTL